MNQWQLVLPSNCDSHRALPAPFIMPRLPERLAPKVLAIASCRPRPCVHRWCRGDDWRGEAAIGCSGRFPFSGRSRSARRVLARFLRASPLVYVPTSLYTIRYLERYARVFMRALRVLVLPLAGRDHRVLHLPRRDVVLHRLGNYRRHQRGARRIRVAPRAKRSRSVRHARDE